MLSQIDATLTTKQRESVEEIEKVMRSWCDTSKGKDKTMCYYMGVGDAEQGTSGGVKRDISGSLSRGINAKRLCVPRTLRTTRAAACSATQRARDLWASAARSLSRARTRVLTRVHRA